MGVFWIWGNFILCLKKTKQQLQTNKHNIEKHRLHEAAPGQSGLALMNEGLGVRELKSCEVGENGSSPPTALGDSPGCRPALAMINSSLARSLSLSYTHTHALYYITDNNSYITRRHRHRGNYNTLTSMPVAQINTNVSFLNRVPWWQWNTKINKRHENMDKK